MTTAAERWLTAVWPVVRGRLPAPPARVVEIGCGPLGGFVPMLGASGYEAVGVDPVAPDGKDFKLSFDKESGLPVKLLAIVRGFQGDEFTQETNYSDFTEFDGIKRAKKIETKRNGETFIKLEVIEFKVIEKVDPKAFAKPE